MKTGLESLDTGAPNITYSGNEGPKSPQEMQQMAEFDMKEYMEEFERVFPEMKNKRGTPEYDRDLEEYFQGLASKQGGIGNMASNDQNTIILERLYEKYLEMGLSLEEAEDAAIKEMENMQDDFSSAPEGIRSTMAAQGGRIGFQFGGGSGEKAFSKEENLKRFEAAKRLAKEKGISLQEALDITLSDSYRIEEAQGGRIGFQFGGGFDASRSDFGNRDKDDPTTRDENRREQYAVARTITPRSQSVPTPPGPVVDKGSPEQNLNQKAIVQASRVRALENFIDRPTPLENAINLYKKFSPTGILMSLLSNRKGEKKLPPLLINDDEDDPTLRDEQKIIFPNTMAQVLGPTSMTTDLDTPEDETKDFVNRFARNTVFPFADYVGGREVLAADGGRIGYAGGGITDLRQGYFLGKLVKKATRGIKKLVKSPIGKAALLAAPFMFGPGKTFASSLFGSKLSPQALGGKTPGIMAMLKRGLGFAKENPFLTIGGLSTLPLFMGQDEDDDDLDAVTRQALRGQGLDIPGIRKQALAGNLDRSMFPFMNPSFYAAGGLAENLTPRQAALSAMYGENNDDEEEKKLAYGGSAGMPPITQGTEGQISQSFSDDETPMPTQPDQMPRMNPMMARGMNPMMARGMNPMMNRGMMSMQQPRIMAQEGGMMDMGGMEKDYRNEGGFVPIGGQERADDVPARLSKNEFVFTADAVRNAGGGDIDKGAEIMENMMENLEQGGKVSKASQGLSGAREMFATQQRLEEVL